ncbi:MAG: AraC family transcriptional regulator [Methyloligellaceae bacterium]
MAKTFVAGDFVPDHSHRRDQLLYAISGAMRVRMAGDVWIVPPDRAVYVPANIVHSVDSCGQVEMRTLYISPDASPDLPRQPVGLEVSALLRALVLALLEEPIEYDGAGRGGLLAKLILHEISSARRLALAIPMPRDARLQRLCTALLADPCRDETLDAWAEIVGASPRTLTRLFDREVGMTFRAWRQRVRFHSALEALARGEPVQNVAHANGYASPSAFTAAFRKALGVAPSRLVTIGDGP